MPKRLYASGTMSLRPFYYGELHVRLFVPVHYCHQTSRVSDRAAAAQLEEFRAVAAPDASGGAPHIAGGIHSRAHTPRLARGNHKYAWPLTAAMRGALPATLPYPNARRGGDMWFWFIFAAMMGPKFFRCFMVLFALGMGVMLYSLVRS